MRKSIIIKLSLAVAFLIVSFSSCTMYQETMTKTSYPPVSKKIPNVTIEAKATCAIAGEDFNIMEKTIKDELFTNVISTETYSKGSMEIICDKYVLKSSFIIPYLSGLSLFSLNLIGFPISSVGIDTRLKFNIYDDSHNLIKNYSYDVTDKSVMGFYYGKSGRVVLVDVTKKALADFRKDIERDAQYITEKLNSSSTLPQNEPQKQVQGYGDTALEQTIIRWDVQSRPQGTDIFWRVVSKTPDVKSTNNKYLMTTPYEATKALDIRGLTYQTSGNVRIVLRCEKEGYMPQEKEYDVRMVLDQEEISAFFRLVKEE